MTAATNPALNKVKLEFLKEIASRCNGARPTVRNTRECYDHMVYTVKVKDDDDYGAQNYLEQLGFVSEHVKATGNSTHGDFSSNVYGVKLTHPSGVQVSCSSSFSSSTPTFTIRIVGSEEQIAALMVD